MDRRAFIRAAAAAGVAAPFAARADGHLRRTLDLTDPADCLTALVKMRASLEAVDCPHWYFGTIYAVLPGKGPIAMVDYEGSEIDYYERQPDGTYRAYGATVSFFRDTRTGKRIDKFENPITGKINDVRPNSITVKAYYILSEFGMKRSDDERPLGDERILPSQMKWQESGDHIWLRMNRPYPAGLAMGEDQTIRGLLRELHDPDSPKVYATGKLDSVEQYPRELLDFMEKNFPEKLTAKPA
jgi:hypothetical protein